MNRESKARQIVYRYDADDSKNEMIVDMDGTEEIPKQGHVIERKGSRWKVVQVTTEKSVSANGPIPIVRISLTSDLNLPVQVHK